GREGPAPRTGGEAAFGPGKLGGGAGVSRAGVLRVLLPDETRPGGRGRGEAGALSQDLPRFFGPAIGTAVRREDRPALVGAMAARRACARELNRGAAARPVPGRSVPEHRRRRGGRTVLPPGRGRRPQRYHPPEQCARPGSVPVAGEEAPRLRRA